MSSPDVTAWDPWTPAEAAARLAGVTFCVGGGWAVSLHAGRVTRRHGDLEVGVVRGDYLAARDALRDLAPYAAVGGKVVPLAEGEEPPGDHFQTWFHDGDAWRVDVMIEPGDADTWVYRRDESLSAPRSFMVGHSSDGIPYLLPHGGLLFKAKYGRAKDEADFAVAAPLLTEEQLAWLVAALERFHPDHSWLAALASPPR